MFTSPNLRRLVTQLLICSLFAAGLSGLTTRVSRASAKHLPLSPAPIISATPEQIAAPSAPQTKTVDEATRARVQEAYAKSPLSFEENRGQVDAQVRYIARGQGYTLFLTQTEAVLSLSRAGGEARKKKDRLRRQRDPHMATRAPRPDVLRMKLRGANRSPAVTAESETGARVNYFKGSDPKNWHTGVARFERVRYAEVYPGVDVIYYGKQQQLEYDFEVAPGADTKQIALEFEGVRRMKVERRTGELVLKTATGEVRQRKPVAYQEVGGERREVLSSYVMRGEREVGFEVGEYDRTKPLVIDPVLSYSSYLGTTENDYPTGIAADASGYAYVTGYTYSLDFPTKNEYQSSQDGNGGFSHAFVSKFDTNLTGEASLVYSTYLGGSSGGTDIAVDSSGVVYVLGGAAFNFPTKNEYQSCERGGLFVTKLDTNVSGPGALLYSTCLRGNSFDVPVGLAIDPAGNAYVVGHTNSKDFPTLNQFQTNQSDTDVFVTKLDTNATGAASLRYSTYLGGNFTDEAGGIAADASGNVYVTGHTSSTNFPTKNQLQKNQPDLDAFVARLDTNLAGEASLVYSTYLGGSKYDLGWGVAADAHGNAYVTGWTASPEFPVKNQYQMGNGNWYDVFVTKLDTNEAGADSLLYSTYIGGTDFDWSTGIALDATGNVYVIADTLSWDFPTKDPLQCFQGEYDVVIFKLNPNLAGEASLLYSTYLGGSYWDFSAGITLDPLGNLYVTGYTFSDDFPTRRQYQTRQFGMTPWNFPNADGFVAKFPTSHRISGRVTGDDTRGIGGVTVTLDGAKHATALTSGGGKYSFDGLVAGGDYTITVARGDLRFTPSRLSVDDLAADYAGADFTTHDKAAIGGKVTLGTGAGLSGVTMTLTGGTNFAPRTATTDSYGTYSFVNLPAGGSYKLTPSKTNYSFGPTQQVAINLTGPRPDTDFGATLRTYTIGGVVRVDNGASMEGVIVRLTRQTPAGFIAQETITDGAGAYLFTDLPAGRTYTVTPSLDGFRFGPAARSVVNLSASQTTVNFWIKRYPVRGRVTRAGTTTGIAGVTITMTSLWPEFMSFTTETDSKGFYSFPTLPAGRSYTFTAKKQGFTFSPAKRTITNLSGGITVGPSMSFIGTGP